MTAGSNLTATVPPLTADLGEVTLAYYDNGHGAGPPVVFSHGYPDIAFGWRHQLQALDQAGRRVIAPDQRGYGASSRPVEVEAYDIDRLTGDMVRLLDHLGIERAVFCGHDWGGNVAWHMPLIHPDRTAGVIGVCTPWFPLAPIDPIVGLQALLGPDMYIVSFQTPHEPEAIMDSRVATAMDFYMRRPVAGSTPTQGFASVRGPGDPSVFPLLKQIEAYDPAADPRERLLSDADMAVYVAAFEASGFGGGINWYRNLSRNWTRAKDLPQRIDGLPCLMITADLDPWLPPSSADGLEERVSDLTRVDITGSGHWVQMEQPQAVNRAIQDWLSNRYGPVA